MSPSAVPDGARPPRAVSELSDVTFDLVVTVCNEARDFRDQVLTVDQEKKECPSGKSPLLVGAPIHIDWFVADPAL